MPRAVPPAIASKLPAAAAVFAEHGVDGTSIKDISVLIGVPRATLYYYFAGKEDILAFLLRSLLDDIARRVADTLASGDAAIHRLRAVLAAQLEVLGSNPDAAQLLVANLGRPVASRTSHRLSTPRSTSLYETSSRLVRPTAPCDR